MIIWKLSNFFQNFMGWKFEKFRKIQNWNIFKILVSGNSGDDRINFNRGMKSKNLTINPWIFLWRLNQIDPSFVSDCRTTHNTFGFVELEIKLEEVFLKIQLKEKTYPVSLYHLFEYVYHWLQCWYSQVRYIDSVAITYLNSKSLAIIVSELLNKNRVPVWKKWTNIYKYSVFVSEPQEVGSQRSQ